MKFIKMKTSMKPTQQWIKDFRLRRTKFLQYSRYNNVWLKFPTGKIAWKFIRLKPPSDFKYWQETLGKRFPNGCLVLESTTDDWGYSRCKYVSPETLRKLKFCYIDGELLE